MTIPLGAVIFNLRGRLVILVGSKSGDMRDV